MGRQSNNTRHTLRVRNVCPVQPTESADCASAQYLHMFLHKVLLAEDTRQEQDRSAWNILEAGQGGREIESLGGDLVYWHGCLYVSIRHVVVVLEHSLKIVLK